MGIAERIARFLKQNRGVPFCDDCLERALALKRRQQAQQATNPLGQTPGYTRRDRPVHRAEKRNCRFPQTEKSALMVNALTLRLVAEGPLTKREQIRPSRAAK